MEKTILGQNELINNKMKFEIALQKVEKITDKLGKKIEDGIKEAVAILNAMDIQTNSSCAGHKGEEGKFGLPYIEIYTPSLKGWNENKGNKQLGEQWKQNNLKQREIIQPLFEEFNKTRIVPPDVKLKIRDMGIFGGFKIENVGGMTPTQKEEAIRMIESYQKEMAEFTKFLKEKFLNS